MKLRGNLGGFSLLLESGDTPESLRAELRAKAEFLNKPIALEFTDTLPGAVLEAALEGIREAGGTLKNLRGHSTRVDRTPEIGSPIVPRNGTPSTPPGGRSSEPQGVSVMSAPSSPAPAPAGHGAEIVRHSLRAGTRAEYPGSVVVLGDVNSGVEILAGGDIVVLGTLRGVAHAGRGGNLEAVVVGYPIASPIISIGETVANDPEASGWNTMRTHAGEGQVARVRDGRIFIEKYGRD